MSRAMNTVRTVVFPALRLLVWTVIAVALVVLAFRGGTGEAAPGRRRRCRAGRRRST